MRKNWFVVFEITKCCKPLSLLGFVPFPLSVEEVVHWIVVIPLSEEVIVVIWLCAYPSIVRLILCWLCASPLVRGCICWERSCLLPNCICPNPQWRFPVWEVLCGRYSGNPSVWRRGRRAGCLNLETYLYVCVWSTISNSLSLSLSYIVPCIIS